MAWQDLSDGKKAGIIIAIVCGSFFTLLFFIIVIAAVFSTPAVPSEQKITTTEEKQKAETVKEEPKPKAWVEVASLSGSTNKRSPVFELTGAEARMRYTFDGGSYALLAAYIVEDGQSLMEDGGFPEISADGASSDETRIVKSPGNYYLDITSANGSWTVVVEEYR